MSGWELVIIGEPRFVCRGNMLIDFQCYKCRFARDPSLSKQNTERENRYPQDQLFRRKTMNARDNQLTELTIINLFFLSHDT